MRDVIIRALKTFFQSFVAVIVAAPYAGMDVGDKAAFTALLVSACAAGISALMNTDWYSVGKADDGK